MWLAFQFLWKLRRHHAPNFRRYVALTCSIALQGHVENLLSIFQAFSDWTPEQMRNHFSGMRYGDLKKQVAEMVAVSLEPIQKRYREIVSEPGCLTGVLRESAARVRPMALETVEMVKQRMGLYTIS